MYVIATFASATRSLLSPMSAYGTKLPQVERGIDQVEVVLGWAVRTVVDS